MVGHALRVDTSCGLSPTRLWLYIWMTSSSSTRVGKSTCNTYPTGPSNLRQHKLCANLEKCTFGMDQVQYLGYIIDEPPGSRTKQDRIYRFP
jgi:hypothetical protein